MDVLSIESCVKAVIGAYRDASKLVQRLRAKAKTSEDFILPEDLAQEFEDSLSLGCVTVQSQYDHDVRRFGETYARGDSVAREQMKDILITLQHSVLSHLREVFMDEATLNLYSVKETSDDSRVNAIVCLGQLYQRMSTAASAMKQMARPTANEPDRVNLGYSLGYSSSHSTHSSVGAKTLDRESATTFSTYSSRTATGTHDRKPSSTLLPQRRASMTSSFSYNSDREYRDGPKSRTPGDEGVPALPSTNPSRNGRESGDNTSSAGLPSPGILTPPPYKQDASSPISNGDQKGQYFPQTSSFYQEPTPVRSQLSEKASHGQLVKLHPAPPKPVKRQQFYEMPEDNQPKEPRKPQLSDTEPVPLNPEYSTLESVVSLNIRTRPRAEIVDMEQDRQQQQVDMYMRPPTSYDSTSDQSSPTYSRYGGLQETLSSPRPQTSSSDIHGSPLDETVVDPLFESKVPVIPLARTGSIRSTGSTGSRLSAFVLRKALPPGIAEHVQKPAQSPEEEAANSQPRYVKPLELKNEQTVRSGPTSPVAKHMETFSLDQAVEAPESESQQPPLEETMRVQSPSFQCSRSELNLPSEANQYGFCKGAVRLQLGGRKKGFALENKRGVKGQEYFFKCTKCDFTGPAQVSKALPSGGRGAVKVDKTMDTTVRTSPGGIKYRWAFLAKSHTISKTLLYDSKYNFATFGCYFCCAEGAAKGWVEDGVNAQLAMLGGFGGNKATTTATTTTSTTNVTLATPTPKFIGLPAFLAHMETHRQAKRRPGLIASNEMNCIVGRMAGDNEDFDLCLPPL